MSSATSRIVGACPVSTKRIMAAATVYGVRRDDQGEALHGDPSHDPGTARHHGRRAARDVQLGDRFDEVRVHASKEARALRLKFDVTDVNGWQTAYGYDGGRSRPRFERSVAAFRRDLRSAARALGDPRERELLGLLRGEFGAFMGLDVAAYRELRAGRAERTREIFLGPEIQRFEAMAGTADDLADYEARRAAAT